MQSRDLIQCRAVFAGPPRDTTQESLEPVEPSDSVSAHGDASEDDESMLQWSRYSADIGVERFESL